MPLLFEFCKLIINDGNEAVVLLSK